MQQITQDTLRELGVVSGAGQYVVLVDDKAPFHDHQQGTPIASWSTVCGGQQAQG